MGVNKSIALFHQNSSKSTLACNFPCDVYHEALTKDTAMPTRHPWPGVQDGFAHCPTEICSPVVHENFFWGWGGEWGELSMKCFHFRGGEGLTILDKSALTKELQCHHGPLAWGNHPWQICSNSYPREVIFRGERAILSKLGYKLSMRRFHFYGREWGVNSPSQFN